MLNWSDTFLPLSALVGKGKKDKKAAKYKRYEICIKKHMKKKREKITDADEENSLENDKPEAEEMYITVRSEED